MKPTTYNRAYCMATLLLTAIIAVTWRLVGYYSSDDWIYGMTNESSVPADFWEMVGTPITSLREALTSAWYQHYVFSRIPNLLGPIAMWMPRWIPEGFVGILVAVMLLLLIKITSSGAPRRATVVGATALIWCALPWYDGFVSMMYVLNYVPTSVLCLWLVWYINRRPEIKGVTWAWLVPVTIAIGWMHEGFTTVMIAYVSIYALSIYLQDKRELKRAASLMIVVAALFGGLALCLISDTSVRAADLLEAHNADNTLRYIWTRLVSELWPVWLASAALIWMWIRARRLGVRPSHLLIASCAAMMTGTAQVLTLNFIGRALWPPILFACIIILYAIQNLPRIKGLRCVANAVCIVLLLGYGLWGISLCYWQAKVGNDIRRLHLEAAESHSTLFYADITHNDDLPFWLMGIVHQQHDSEPWTINTFARYHRGLHDATIDLSSGETTALILPSNLEGKSAQDIYNVSPAELWPLIANPEHASRATITVGAPLPSVTPIDRLLMLLCTADTACIDVKLSTSVIALPDGTTAVIAVPELLPRTMRHRQIIASEPLPETTK